MNDLKFDFCQLLTILGCTAVAMAVLGGELSAAAAADAERLTAICAQHLKAIDAAQRAYEQEKGEPPSHLTDLYPKYLPDKETLVCPSDSPKRGSTNLSTSYSFNLSSDTIPDPGYFFPQLGPKQGRPDITWREVNRAQRENFGDRVPVVTCSHHSGYSVNLSATGEIYRRRSAWDIEPKTLTAMLERLENDLSKGPEQFTNRWELGRVEGHCLDWMALPLPPALRFGLGRVAERLCDSAKLFPRPSQAEVYRLGARLFSAAGRTKDAMKACERSLHSPGNHEGANFISEDLRFRSDSRKGAPPLDAYLRSELARLGIPGFSVGIFRGGKVLLAKGYGLEDKSSPVAASENSVYPILSASKMFTGMGILMLVEAGKLSLDDKIMDFISGVPSSWTNVNIRHLLTHTSGIGNLLSLPEWYKIGTVEEALSKVYALPCEFQPGEKWSYNQTGYILLKLLIEKLSGRSFPDFMTERIFQPLQMKATRFGDPNAPGAFVQAANGLTTSVSDLAKWDAALYTEKLLKRSSLEKLWSPTKLNDGSLAQYGFGWGLGTYRGQKNAGHGGGMQNWIARYPEAQLTVVVLAKTFGVNTHPLVDKLADFYLPPQKPSDDNDPKTTANLRKALNRLVDGRADENAFAPDLFQDLCSEFGHIRQFYRFIGPLRSFQLIEQKTTETGVARSYRAVFGGMPWIQTFTSAESGKIAEVLIAPEYQ